jgi:hypothetical protein
MAVNHLKTLVIYTHFLFSIALLTGCNPKADTFALLNQSQGFTGYIVVANSLNKSVVMLDGDGAHVRDLMSLDRTSTEYPGGLASYNNGQDILVTIDSAAADRVNRIRLSDGFQENGFILNGNLTGVLRGIATLSSGYIIITEGASIEQFLTPTLRQTVGWPIAPMTGGTTLRPVPSTGGFIHCSFTTDAIRTYNSAGTQTATQVSGIAGTTDAMGCATNSSARVAVSWNGTTDTVRMYLDLTLSNTGAISYSNTTLLPSPHGVDFLPNGNMIVADFSTNLLVEITQAGNLVRTISSPSVSGPIDLLVIR